MAQCIRCKHGKFMQWMKNPIICECTLTNERFVAESLKVCAQFDPSYNETPHIEHFNQY